VPITRRSRSAERASAFFFLFAVPFDERPDRDFSSAGLAQWRLLVTNLLASGPKEQACAAWLTFEMLAARVTVVAAGTLVRAGSAAQRGVLGLEHDRYGKAVHGAQYTPPSPSVPPTSPWARKGWAIGLNAGEAGARRAEASA
jgi:hypothetical protein